MTGRNALRPITTEMFFGHTAQHSVRLHHGFNVIFTVGTEQRSVLATECINPYCLLLQSRSVRFNNTL